MPHDFAKLRAERNANRAAWAEQMRAEGFDVSSVCADLDDNACYCACGVGGPCEHDWHGPTWHSPDGLVESTTCTRCGEVAMRHDMRVMP